MSTSSSSSRKQPKRPVGAAVQRWAFSPAAIVFFIGDLVISKAGYRNRKDIGGQEQDAGQFAIVLGTVLDGVPDPPCWSTVLQTGNVAASMLVAVFVSNLPESIAATTSLRNSGWTNRAVWCLWAGIALVCGISAAVGYALLDGASPSTLAFMFAFAGGAILTMLSTSMMPEAYEHAGRTVGLPRHSASPWRSGSTGCREQRGTPVRSIRKSVDRASDTVDGWMVSAPSETRSRRGVSPGASQGASQCASECDGGVTNVTRVGVLGPVRIEVRGVERPITARRQRAVLACLALHAGEAVSADRLLDDVWGDEQPDSGVRAVAYQVSKLRSLLEPDRTGEGSLITTTSAGYVLHVESEHVDVNEFDHLVDLRGMPCRRIRPRRRR